MERKRTVPGGRWWLLWLPVAVLALAEVSGGAVAVAPAGEFPAFIPMTDVTPRGVAVDKVGNVYVAVGQGSGSSEHILIRKYTPSGAGPMFIADIGQGTIGGLMITANGDLYVALAAGTNRGVWRVDRKGDKVLLPNSGSIFFANGLAFDDDGTLYVTESVSLTVISNGKPAGPGSIWRIRPGGQAELWMRDELLRGTGALGQPVWFGANGIAYYQDAEQEDHDGEGQQGSNDVGLGCLYVTNTEKGTVLRIPVKEDGSPGVPDVWELHSVPGTPIPLPPRGDGIALDVHGNLYVAVLTQSAIVRINARDRSQETVAAFPESRLDFPASLFFGTGKGERTSLFVTNLGTGAAMFPSLSWDGPGLVKIDAGVPGRPLH